MNECAPIAFAYNHRREWLQNAFATVKTVFNVLRARRSVIMFGCVLHTIQFCGEEFYNGIAWRNKLNHDTNDDWFAAGVGPCENMPS